MKEQKNNKRPNKRRSIIYVVGVSIVLFLAVLLVVIYSQTLSRRIADLEAQTIKMAKQAESFKRSYCSATFTDTAPNTAMVHHLESAGYDRTYRVHTPRNYDPSVRYPVVMSFDGIEGSGARIESYSGMDALPVIAVYPDALIGKQKFTAWQGAPYAVDGDRDMQFVKDLLDTLPSQYCTDSTKLFTVGMSNGGGFATLVGCSMSDQIRAVVSVSGAYYTTCKPEGRTPSLMVIHSKSDKQVPFLGSKKRKLPDIPQWVNDKAAARQCQDKTQGALSSSTTYYNWSSCKDDSLLRFVVIDHQNHGWLQIPDATDNKSDTTESIWRFFQDVMYDNEPQSDKSTTELL